MLEPRIPNNELERIQALHALKILDTEPEERFDRLTRLAQRVFQVPIALVSLVDDHRQWFKSCFGLDVRETSRDISFCAHTILSKDLLIIEDARKDLRFSDNPLVTTPPNIRFYAGYPIQGANGTRLGTFCIIDTQPRTFSPQDILIFEDLAVLAERELAAVQVTTLDDLTGITNRRGFNILSSFSFQMCQRMELPLSMAYIDLNKFKEINDNYGHHAGDKVLKMFSYLLSKELREPDIFARIGGDEFAILFTDTTQEQAEQIMLRFKQALEAYNTSSCRPYQIRFSYGISSYDNVRDGSLEALIEEADKLMYQGKSLS